jgi:hypothetical protein
MLNPSKAVGRESGRTKLYRATGHRVHGAAQVGFGGCVTISGYRLVRRFWTDNNNLAALGVIKSGFAIA